MNRFTVILAASFSWLIGAIGVCKDQVPDSDIAFCKIRIGAVEHSKERAGRLIFHWEEGDQLLDLHPLGKYVNKFGPPGIPHLTRWGVRLEDDSIHEFGEWDEEEVLKRIFEKNPGLKVKSTIYRGINDSRLEINTIGLTGVCRVDIVLTEGARGERDLVFWRNIPLMEASK